MEAACGAAIARAEFKEERDHEDSVADAQLLLTRSGSRVEKVNILRANMFSPRRKET